MAVVALIGARGIQNGIEKVCKVLLPLLFIILVVLISVCVHDPGNCNGIEFYLKPDWAQLANPLDGAAAGMALCAGACNWLPRWERQICR